MSDAKCGSNVKHKIFKVDEKAYRCNHCKFDNVVFNSVVAPMTCSNCGHGHLKLVDHQIIDHRMRVEQVKV